MTTPMPPEKVLHKGLSSGQGVGRTPGRTFFSPPLVAGAILDGQTLKKMTEGWLANTPPDKL